MKKLQKDLILILKLPIPPKVGPMREPSPLLGARARSAIRPIQYLKNQARFLHLPISQQQPAIFLTHNQTLWPKPLPKI